MGEAHRNLANIAVSRTPSRSPKRHGKLQARYSAHHLASRLRCTAKVGRITPIGEGSKEEAVLLAGGLAELAVNVLIRRVAERVSSFSFLWMKSLVLLAGSHRSARSHRSINPLLRLREISLHRSGEGWLAFGSQQAS